MASKRSKSVEQLTSSLGLNEINDLLHNRKKLFWLNFHTGFTHGFAGILGAAAAIVVIGFVVSLFGGLPYIGNFLEKLGEAVQGK